jgi:hypothetical protein
LSVYTKFCTPSQVGVGSKFTRPSHSKITTAIA